MGLLGRLVTWFWVISVLAVLVSALAVTNSGGIDWTNDCYSKTRNHMCIPAIWHLNHTAPPPALASEFQSKNLWGMFATCWNLFIVVYNALVPFVTVFLKAIDAVFVRAERLVG